MNVPRLEALWGRAHLFVLCLSSAWRHGDLVHDSSAHRHYAVQTVEITGPDSELTYSGINQESVKPRSVQSGVRSESKS